MRQLYSENDDFKTFVDRYCQAKNISVDVALTHQTIKDVGEYYSSLSNTGVGILCGNPKINCS